MKLSLKCDVHSDIVLSRRLELKAGDSTYCFEVDKQGRWNAVEIRVDLPDPSKISWGLEPVLEPRQPNQAPGNVVGDFGPGLYESAVESLQALESTLSVFFPVRSVDWRYPAMTVIFEDGDEKVQNIRHLQNIRISRQRPGSTRVEEQSFVRIVGFAMHAQTLTVIESFWREGQNDWLAGKFINGFFNFYFVLEGLYGNRNTQTRLVQKAFKISPELIANIDAFLAEDHPDEALTQLIKMFEVGNRLPTPEEVIDMLVSTGANCTISKITLTGRKAHH